MKSARKPGLQIADCPAPESPWKPVINPPLQHASANIEQVRPQSNDERRASWAAKYYLHGHHHTTTRSPDAPGRDWFASDECAAVLAQRFEPETENPFAHDCEPEPEIEA